MKIRNPSRRSAILATCGLVAAAVIGLTPAMGNAATATATSSGNAAVQPAPYRQLLGRVTGPQLFESSVPVNGTYAFEYVIRDGVFAAYDTYVNDRLPSLGYTGGVPGGPYRTGKAVQLNAGGHLVKVVGPEGSGSADVYIVQIS